MKAIRADLEIRVAEAKISQLRSTEEYERLSRHIRDQRDALEQRFRECRCFSESLCEDWADRVASIDRAAEDDRAALWDLSADFTAAFERLQRELTDIAAAIGDDSVLPPERDAPVLVRLHDARHAARGTVKRVRSLIAPCQELRADTRERWLRALPDPEHGLSWLRDRLQAQVMRELESVSQFTARTRSDLQLLERFLTDRADA